MNQHRAGRLGTLQPRLELAVELAMLCARWIVACGLALAACQAHAPDGVFRCSTDAECPDKQRCYSSICSSHPELQNDADAAGHDDENEPSMSTLPAAAGGGVGGLAESAAAGTKASGSSRPDSGVAGAHAAAAGGSQAMVAGGAGAVGGAVGGAGDGTGTSEAAGRGGAAGAESASGCVPSPEICDNQDNDCDAKIDEEVTRPCGSNIGECKQGTETCSAGTWSTECNGGVGPVLEVCDAAMKDENCDGSSNENCPCTNGQTQACGNATSPCSQGMRTCTNGSWGDDSDCVGGTRPSAEKCDGIDNDCNGTVDDRAPCTGGQKCVAGSCVECAGDGDCAKLTGGCNVGRCVAGTCMKANSGDGARCSMTSGASGVCKAGACVGCINNSQCSVTAPAAGVCNTATNTCVQCVVTNDCAQAQMVCTANHCMSTCGNGQIDPGEQCDVPLQDAYHCDPATCKARALYLTCHPSPTYACDHGEASGQCGYGYCSPVCTSTTDCPVARSTDKVQCSGGICTLTCTTLSDCPPDFSACSGGICLGQQT